MGTETRTRYSAVLAYGLAIPAVAIRIPCEQLRAIVVGLHRIAADLGLVAVILDRIISSGDNGLVHLSPTMQTDFRRRTMDVASVCCVCVPQWRGQC